MFKLQHSLLAALAAGGLCLTTSACATGHAYTYREERRPDVQRIAYDNGYREGVEEGRADARRGRSFSYERHDEYRNANEGYRRSDGDPDVYRRAFRQGFQAGYRAIFQRNYDPY